MYVKRKALTGPKYDVVDNMKNTIMKEYFRQTKNEHPQTQNTNKKMQGNSSNKKCKKNPHICLRFQRTDHPIKTNFS